MEGLLEEVSLRQSLSPIPCPLSYIPWSSSYCLIMRDGPLD